MAEVNPPSYLQNRTDHTAQSDRMAIGSIVLHEGRVSGADLVVSQASTPNMSVSVSAGRCFIRGTQDTNQGVYHCFSDSATSVAVAAAHASLPRIDSVIARVYDAFYTGADSEWKIEVITGTPAALPDPPALPDNSIRLANIAVSAGATSILNAAISNTSKAASAIDRVLADAAERNRLGMAPGQQYYRTDLAARLFHTS